MHPIAALPTAPYCLAPSSEVEPAAFEMPAGACDTHAHVIAASAAYPMAPSRSYTPPPAPEEKYLAMLDATGCSRGVIVQISVYGTDNGYLLEVLRRNPDRLRGIAVVTPDVTDQELEAMHAAGVRGLRINVLFPGAGLSFEAMETLARRIAPMGWHMQFLVDGRDLPGLLPRMRKLPCPGVIDHMGHMPAALGFQHPGFQAVRELVANHGWWTKLSGAYRISDDFDEFRGRRADRPGSDRSRSGPGGLGQRLAPRGHPSHARYRTTAQPPQGLGPRSGSPEAHPGGQPSPVVRVPLICRRHPPGKPDKRARA